VLRAALARISVAAMARVAVLVVFLKTLSIYLEVVLSLLVAAAQRVRLVRKAQTQRL